MHLVLGGAVLAVILLLALSTPGAENDRKHVENTLLGALAVAAMVLVLTKAGMPWLAVALALLFTSAKRFGRRNGSKPAPAPGRAPDRPKSDRMTREEAYRVLGLTPGASREAVVAEYRRLMKRVHPDQGGTDYLAAQLNEAKDTLLEG